MLGTLAPQSGPGLCSLQSLVLLSSLKGPNHPPQSARQEGAVPPPVLCLQASQWPRLTTSQSTAMLYWFHLHPTLAAVTLPAMCRASLPTTGISCHVALGCGADLTGDVAVQSELRFPPTMLGGSLRNCSLQGLCHLPAHRAGGQLLMKCSRSFDSLPVQQKQVLLKKPCAPCCE